MPNVKGSVLVAARLHKLEIIITQLNIIYTGNGSVLVAARLHKLESYTDTTEEASSPTQMRPPPRHGRQPPPSVQIEISVRRYLSRVGLGAATMDLFAQGASVVSVELFFPPLPENSRDVGPMRSSRFGKWGRGGEGKEEYWLPCAPPPQESKTNRTRTVVWSTGAEDPRVQFGQAVDGVGCVGGRGGGSVEASAVPCFKGGDEAGSVDVSMTVFSYLPVPPPRAYSAYDPPPVCPRRRWPDAVIAHSERRIHEQGTVYGRMYECAWTSDNAGGKRGGG